MIARFFPGARDELAAIDEEIVRGALGPVEPGKAHCFEDQYLSSGGQLYELMMGHDRFVADLRPLIESVLNGRGLALGICCHPYDVCTELIAREAGVIVTDERGNPLRAPLQVEPDVAWAGYANEAIRREIEPLLHEALKKRGFFELINLCAAESEAETAIEIVRGDAQGLRDVLAVHRDAEQTRRSSRAETRDDSLIRSRSSQSRVLRAGST